MTLDRNASSELGTPKAIGVASGVPDVATDRVAVDSISDVLFGEGSFPLAERPGASRAFLCNAVETSERDAAGRELLVGEDDGGSVSLPFNEVL